MSSSRLILDTLKLSAVASVNMSIVSWGVKQYKHNQSIANQMPAEKRIKLQNDPINKVGNSGDALAAFNERMQRKY